MPRIVIHRDGEGSRVFELAGERPVSIGRAKSSNIMLEDASVSRLHAVVRSTLDGHWQILDRNSANGMKINGKATKEAVLRGNDEITVGVFQLRFEDSAERTITSYGTAQLPRRVSQVLKEPAYSDSFYSGSPYTGSTLVVEPLGDAGTLGMNERERAQAVENENRLLTLLQRVNRAFSQMQTVEQLAQSALDFSLEITAAERGFVMLLDEESVKRRDVSQGSYSFEPAQIRYRAGQLGHHEQRTPQLTISRSIIKQVMQAGLPMLISDGQSDPRLSASQSVANAGIQSAMCAPLGIGNRLRGLLYVDNLSRRGMFTVDDLNTFAVIAMQAGVAINRIRDRREAKKDSQA
ncbi:MAG TPA: GAF domain-containing protein [Candidatus Acidoferrales bacterium]|nr:GAF domain-containing protein [Candidatus Acidoferrales bacterium]